MKNGDNNYTGNFEFSGNFEILASSPIDSRIIAASVSQLTDEEHWDWGGAASYLYDGLVVAVYNDNNQKNIGLWMLLDKSNVTATASWYKVSSDFDADAFSQSFADSDTIDFYLTGASMSGKVKVDSLEPTHLLITGTEPTNGDVLSYTGGSFSWVDGASTINVTDILSVTDSITIDLTLTNDIIEANIFDDSLEPNHILANVPTEGYILSYTGGSFSWVDGASTINDVTDILSVDDSSTIDLTLTSGTLSADIFSYSLEPTHIKANNEPAPLVKNFLGWDNDTGSFSWMDARDTFNVKDSCEDIELSNTTDVIAILDVTSGPYANDNANVDTLIASLESWFDSYTSSHAEYIGNLYIAESADASIGENYLDWMYKLRNANNSTNFTWYTGHALSGNAGTEVLLMAFVNESSGVPTENYTVSGSTMAEAVGPLSTGNWYDDYDRFITTWNDMVYFAGVVYPVVPFTPYTQDGAQEFVLHSYMAIVSGPTLSTSEYGSLAGDNYINGSYSNFDGVSNPYIDSNYDSLSKYNWSAILDKHTTGSPTDSLDFTSTDFADDINGILTGDDTALYQASLIDSFSGSVFSIRKLISGSITMEVTPEGCLRLDTIGPDGTTNSSTFSFVDTATIDFTSDGATVSAIVKDDSLEPTHLLITGDEPGVVASGASGSVVLGYKDGTFSWMDTNSFDGSGEILNYTNATPTPETIGGIDVGSTFDEKTMKEMWDALLYPTLWPTAGTPTLSLGISGQLSSNQVYDISDDSTLTYTLTADIHRALYVPHYSGTEYVAGLPSNWTWSGELSGTFNGTGTGGPQTYIHATSSTLDISGAPGSYTWTINPTVADGEYPYSSKGTTSSEHSYWVDNLNSKSITVYSAYPLFSNSADIGTFTKQVIFRPLTVSSVPPTTGDRDVALVGNTGYWNASKRCFYFKIEENDWGGGDRKEFYIPKYIYDMGTVTLHIHNGTIYTTASVTWTIDTNASYNGGIDYVKYTETSGNSLGVWYIKLFII